MVLVRRKFVAEPIHFHRSSKVWQDCCSWHSWITYSYILSEYLFFFRWRIVTTSGHDKLFAQMELCICIIWAIQLLVQVMEFTIVSRKYAPPPLPAFVAQTRTEVFFLPRISPPPAPSEGRVQAPNCLNNALHHSVLDSRPQRIKTTKILGPSWDFSPSPPFDPNLLGKMGPPREPGAPLRHTL